MTRRDYSVMDKTYRTPLANHTHDVTWVDKSGFTITMRRYRECTAQGEAKFQQRMGNDAQVVALSN
jgi:hypothetical protein